EPSWIKATGFEEGKALYSNVSDQGLDLYRIKSETSWGATQKSLVNFRSSPPLINMYVVDSLAVSTAGIRLDVGNGETDFEWGLLYELGAVNKDTVVVTLVSDFQLTDESCLSGWMKKSNDLPVDIIVTPSRVHQIDTKYEKPKEGILLTILSKDKLKKLPSNYCIGPKPSSPQNSHTKTFARERCYD
ncbi:Methenyltetrahydrofolate synthase domaincontaining proteinlike, partial [Caligus rogercresseyi]